MQNSRPLKAIKIIKPIIFIITGLVAFNFFNVLRTPNSGNIYFSISAPKAQAVFSAGDNTFVTKMLDGQIPEGKWIHDIYNTARGFLNILLVVFLLYIAFRNILHLDIESYAIKKMIPKVLGVAVFANIAIIILTLTSSIVDRLAMLNIFRPQPVTFLSLFGGISLEAGLGSGIVAAIATWILSMFVSAGVTTAFGICLGCGALLIVLIPTILIAILSLFMAFRPWIIFISAAISPLAIGCTILPQTEPLFKKWLKITLFWLFYPLLVFALIYLALKIPNFSGAAGDGPISSIIGLILPTALRFFIILTAIRAPFMWEKDIGGVIARVGNLAGKAGWAGVGYLMGSGAYTLQKIRSYKAGKEAEEKAIKNIENYTANKKKSHIAEHIAELRKSAIDEFIRRQAKNAGIEGPNAVDTYLDRKKSGNETTDDVKNRIASENKDEIDELARQMYIEEEKKRAVEKFRGSFGNRLLETVQILNPYGIVSALRSRFESGAKEMDKAAWRKSIFSQIAAGPLVTQQVQREIAKGDLSGIYTLEDLEEFMGSSMQKMVKAYMKRNGIEEGKEEEVKDRILEILQYLHRTAAGKLDYQIYFGDLLSSSFTQHDLATVIEGYAKDRQLASQTARSTRSAAEQRELTENLVRQSFGRMLWRGASGAERPPGGGASGAEATYGDVSGPLTPADKKMIELLNGIRQDLRQSGGSKTPFDIAEARVQNLDLSDITPDHYLKLVSQTNDTLSQIRQHTNDPNFVQALIDSNGMNIESLMGRIGNDTKLQELVQNFQVQRSTQLALLTKVGGAQTVERISQMIIKQELDDDAIQKIKNACTSFTKSDIAPAELENSKKILGSILGRGGETITQEDALKIARTLEVLIPRKPIGQQGGAI